MTGRFLVVLLAPVLLALETVPWVTERWFADGGYFSHGPLVPIMAVAWCAWRVRRERHVGGGARGRGSRCAPRGGGRALAAPRRVPESCLWGAWHLPPLPGLRPQPTHASARARDLLPGDRVGGRGRLQGPLSCFFQRRPQSCSGNSTCSRQRAAVDLILVPVWRRLHPRLRGGHVARPDRPWGAPDPRLVQHPIGCPGHRARA